MRKFKVQFEGECILELDDEVINIVDEDWRASLYDLWTPEEIAEHIANNFIANGCSSISELDGWADFDHSAARMTEEEFRFEASELAFSGD